MPHLQTETYAGIVEYALELQSWGAHCNADKARLQEWAERESTDEP